MRTKKEIMKKIEALKADAMKSIKERYPHHPHFSSAHCSPRIHSKILALEWVLENVSDIGGNP